VAKPSLINLFRVSQFIALERSGDTEIQGRDSFFSLPPLRGKAQKVAKPSLINLFRVSQFIALERSGDTEFQGRDSFFSLPPSRGKVPNATSREADGGPS
jgi:hypothetical protein